MTMHTKYKFYIVIQVKGYQKAYHKVDGIGLVLTTVEEIKIIGKFGQSIGLIVIPFDEWGEYASASGYRFAHHWVQPLDLHVKSLSV